MQVNYEGFVQGHRITVNSYGKFQIGPIPGQERPLMANTPEELRREVPGYLEGAEQQLEYEREERRAYAIEKKQRAAKVGNTEAWTLHGGSQYKSYSLEEPPPYRMVRVTVRGKKQRSRNREALVTINGTNTSMGESSLYLGTAEDMKEYEALLLDYFRKDKLAEAAKESFRYQKLYGGGYGMNTDFKRQVSTITATYNNDGTWTISAEGIEDFTVEGPEGFRKAEDKAKLKLVALNHPWAQQSVDDSWYDFVEQKVVPVTDYDGSSTPSYVYPSREVADEVVAKHNAKHAAHQAVKAWEKAHRYDYGWKE